MTGRLHDLGSTKKLWRSFCPSRNSGGSFGPGGCLCITGHDSPDVYVVELPSASKILVWVVTSYISDISGQGIAWNRSQGRNGSLYGTHRGEAHVVEMTAPLQDCQWNVPVPVGAVYGPGQFNRS